MINKVALLLSGKPRFDEYSYQNIYKNIIEPLNADVYIYTFCSPKELQSIIETYLPNLKKICGEFESPKITEWQCNKAPETTIKSVLYMSKHYREVYNLVAQTYKKYDWMIRTRLDLVIDTKIDHEYLNKLNQNAYQIPVGANFRSGINDAFVLCNQENMQKYCNWYNMIPQYTINEGRMFHPESLLRYHLNQQLVPINRLPIVTSLLRKPNNSKDIVAMPHGLDCM